ncbi:MAG: potassium transporter KefB [Patescibacteria group bacterium]|nr:MAG: potassium transporter KefB [Patescibacteria group bacterium]
MSELHSTNIFGVFLFLAFPLIGAVLAVRLRTTPILGYIIGGFALAHVLNRFLPVANLDFLGNIGLILLLFTIGLEVNLNFISKYGKKIILLGLLQISLSFVLFFILFTLLFGYNTSLSLILSSAFSISSTAVVAKLLQEKAEETSLLGSLSLGVLIIQDLALIPLLILSQSLSGDVNVVAVLQQLFLQLSKAVIVIVLIYYLGLKIVPRLFDYFAQFNREILNLFTITFVVFNLYLFNLLHLPTLVAAFLAGVVLAQTLEHQHIFSEIRPFRDFFSILFFSLLGISFSFSGFSQIAFTASIFVLVIFIVKVAVIVFSSLLLRFHSKTAFGLAVNLFQVGEGAFIILTSTKIIPETVYSSSVLSVILLLVLTPFAINNRDLFYAKIKKLLQKHFRPLYNLISVKFDREIPNIDLLNLNNHIVICGYGRVGSYVGRALQLVGQDFIAVDSDISIVKKARSKGVNIIYGDPTNPDVLDYLQIETARILIVAVPSRFDQETIITTAKKINPSIKIFSRVHSESDMHRFKQLGADIIIHSEFEASLSIVRRILLMMNLSKDDVKSKMVRLKIEHWL